MFLTERIIGGSGAFLFTGRPAAGGTFVSVTSDGNLFGLVGASAGAAREAAPDPEICRLGLALGFGTGLMPGNSHAVFPTSVRL